MRMIEELFYGNVTPNERPIKRGSKMEHLAHLMAKNNDAMRDMLKDETLLAQFEKCCGSQNDLAARMEIEAFTEGFCIAACFLTEVIAWLAAQENSDEKSTAEVAGKNRRPPLLLSGFRYTCCVRMVMVEGSKNEDHVILSITTGGVLSMALNLQKRDCGVRMWLNPIGFGNVEFGITTATDLEVQTFNLLICEGLNDLLGALYYFLPDGNTDGFVGEGAERIHYKYVLFNEHRGVKKITDFLDESIQPASFTVAPHYAWFIWGGTSKDENSFLTWSLVRPHDNSSEFSVKVELGFFKQEQEEPKFMSFELPYEDLCYAVAAACTTMIKTRGIMGYHYLMGQGDINIRYLLYIKAVAIGFPELFHLRCENEDYPRYSTDFDDEMQLLYFDM